MTDRDEAEAGIRAMLRMAAEDPMREGLLNTPSRVVNAFMQQTKGYEIDPAEVLATTFEEPYDEMVVVTGVRFASLCEHHLLPFVGHATVGYVPGERVVGLSKLARLVHIYALRLQVQERMTRDIANALEDHLKPKGSGVVVRAHHSCMGTRGAKQPDALMTTSDLRGALREKPEARAEFLALARENGHG